MELKSPCSNIYLLVKWRHLGSIAPRVEKSGVVVEAPMLPEAAVARCHATQFDVINAESQEVCETIDLCLKSTAATN